MVNMPTLKKGDEGQAVAALQEALIAAGVPYARITGKFDDRTESFVLAYQQHEGITVDGIVGAETWGRLFE